MAKRNEALRSLGMGLIPLGAQMVERLRAEAWWPSLGLVP
jgi:hypothetical protein